MIAPLNVSLDYRCGRLRIVVFYPTWESVLMEKFFFRFASNIYRAHYGKIILCCKTYLWLKFFANSLEQRFPVEREILIAQNLHVISDVVSTEVHVSFPR